MKKENVHDDDDGDEIEQQSDIDPHKVCMASYWTQLIGIICTNESLEEFSLSLDLFGLPKVSRCTSNSLIVLY